MKSRPLCLGNKLFDCAAKIVFNDFGDVSESQWVRLASEQLLDLQGSLVPKRGYEPRYGCPAPILKLSFFCFMLSTNPLFFRKLIARSNGQCRAKSGTSKDARFKGDKVML